MSRYRPIYVQIWNDREFVEASDDLKLVFLHILTTPLSTPFGGYKASKAALADELGWIDEFERYLKAFQEGLAKPFFEYDETTRFLYIPNFLKYNAPGNPNVLKSWGKLYHELPDCDLKVEVYKSLQAWTEQASKGFQEAFKEAFTEGLNKAFLETGDNSKKGSAPVTGTGTGTVSVSETADSADGGVDPSTWSPSQMDIDAAKSTGVSDIQIQSYIPRFRQYLLQCQEQNRPMTAATAGKSFRRFCSREKGEDALVNQGTSESGKQFWKMGDRELLDECRKHGVHTVGKSKQDLIDKLIEVNKQ